MKVLNLIIKQKYFDAIMQGRKVQEFREIRPRNEKQYIQLKPDGYPVEDEEGNSLPVHYDAIRFFVGYNKGRDSALVEVESAFVEVLCDENMNNIEYEYNGEIYTAEQITYNLGRIIEKNIKGDQSNGG